MAGFCRIPDTEPGIRSIPNSNVYDYCPKAFRDSWKLNRNMNNHNTRAKDSFYRNKLSLVSFLDI